MSAVYICENPACSLGAVGEPGHFTSGISKEGAFVLKGDPEASYGPGYCPNCGDKGRKAGKDD